MIRAIINFFTINPATIVISFWFDKCVITNYKLKLFTKYVKRNCQKLKKNENVSNDISNVNKLNNYAKRQSFVLNLYTLSIYTDSEVTLKCIF